MTTPANIDAFLLRAIGVRDLGDGISEAGIRETVDHYERLVLTDEELRTSLDRLVRAGLVEFEVGRARIGPLLAPRLPRTASGEVSGARGPWERLATELGGTDAPAV